MKSFSWHPSWALKYESFWSLIHKFALLNHVPLPQALSVFLETSGPRNKIISPQKIISILGISEIDNNYSLLDRGIFYQLGLLIYERSLRFCPYCISCGYHSEIYQFKSLQNCPLHDVPLRTECTSCGSNIDHNLKSRNHEPYRCSKCQEHLWQPYKRYGDYYEINLLKISQSMLKKLQGIVSWLEDIDKSSVYFPNIFNWYDMSGRDSNRFISYTDSKRKYETSLYFKLASETIPTGISEPKSANYQQQISHTYRIKQQSNIMKSNMQPTIIDELINKEIQPIYKSIKRYIVKHSVVIKEYRHMFSSDDYYIYFRDHSIILDKRLRRTTLGFMFWRRYYEYPSKIKRNSTEVDWIQRHSSLKGIPDSAQKWVLLRIFALEVCWSFYEACLLARLKSDRLHDGHTKIRGRYQPYWVIKKEGQSLIITYFPLKKFSILNSKFLKQRNNWIGEPFVADLEL